MRSDIRRKRKKSRIIIPLIALILAAGAGFGVLFFGNRLGLFKNGKMSISDNLSAEEKSLVAEIVPEDKKFSEDFTIDVQVTEAAPTRNTDVLADILVPVTDFYSEKSDISDAEFANLQILTAENSATTDSTAKAGSIELTSLNDLSPEKKLLSVDGKYYLDDFENGAKYRVITFDKDNAETQEIIEKLKEKMPTFPKKTEILTLNQTGVTALTRKLQTKLNETGDGAYFAEKIKDFLSETDLTHISNEVSFADNCKTDSATTTLCADPRMLETIKAIGTDIVELTGNHNNDWSTAANLATIKTYEDNDMKTFGGGKTEADAKVPLEIDQKNTKITWIGVNNSTSSKANGQGATGDKPGANIYDEEIIKKQIKDAKASGSFVIVDVQFFECYSYPERGAEMPSCDAPIENQTKFFRHLIDLGADMVVGTSAHQPQTYEIYEEKPIYYGLGNLFFDQTAWPGTTRSLVLTHYFKDGKLLQTKISPTAYGANFQTELMNKTNAETFVKRLLNSSPKGK